jgi:hypothetical protein
MGIPSFPARPNPTKHLGTPGQHRRRCGQTAEPPRKISVCGAAMASLLMIGRSRRRLWRGRGLLGIVGFFAAACEQAEGRAQQTGQDEFLHRMGLVSECDCSREKYSELPGEKIMHRVFPQVSRIFRHFDQPHRCMVLVRLIPGRGCSKALHGDGFAHALTYSTLPERNFSAASVRERTCSL